MRAFLQMGWQLMREVVGDYQRELKKILERRQESQGSRIN